RGQELPREQLAIAHRPGEDELERAELPLLGEEPHGEEREHEQRDQPVIEEDEAPEPRSLVGAAHEHEEHEVAVEEVAGEEQEHRPEHPRERAARERAELAVTDRVRLTHARPPRRRRAPGTPPRATSRPARERAIPSRAR